MNATADRVTTMNELRRSAAASEASLPIVRAGFGDLQGFELMQRACKALAASTLVPKEFQNNVPNCLIALEMAQRIGASPLMVMQNLYIVHGRPAWSSKFLIASFNQCGRFSAVRFDWAASQGADEWGCRAWAIEKASGDRITGPLITIALAKKEGWYSKSGSKWQTIPELMLMYRAAGWMINTHAPEISMGLNTAEEIGDIFDARSESGTWAVSTVSDLRTEPVVIQEATESRPAPPVPAPASILEEQFEVEPAAASVATAPTDTESLYADRVIMVQDCEDLGQLEYVAGLDISEFSENQVKLLAAAIEKKRKTFAPAPRKAS